MENLEQIRLLSEEELGERLKGLLSVAKVSDKHLSKWFMFDGAALGAVRGGEFIPWDWDVEIAEMTEEARPKTKLICRDLKAEGLVMAKKDPSRVISRMSVTGFGTSYEILGRYLKRGNVRARLMTEVPARFLIESEKAAIRGHLFPVTPPVRDYLTVNYGDWETPHRTSNHEEFLGASVYVNRTTVRRELTAIAIRGRRFVQRIWLHLRKKLRSKRMV